MMAALFRPLEGLGRRLRLEPLDQWFLGLRAAVFVAGVVWWIGAPDWPLTPQLPILVAFLVFTIGLYLLNALWPGHLETLYRGALVFDLGVVFFLVRDTADYASDVYLGFILIVALHAFSSGVPTGLSAAAAAGGLYALALPWPPPMPGFALRVAFFGLVGLCMGVVAEQAHRRQRELERQHEQLLRSDRLATVGELAAGLAHELRNPLAGIAGTLHVLATDPAFSDEHRALLADVQAQIARMNKTLTDLLQHARPARPERIVVDINAVVEQTLKFLPRNGVELVRRFTESLPPVWVDPSLLHQALLNVFVNARQAMPHGGRLTVETRPGREPAAGVEVTIADTGSGIPPAHLERIFQPFFTTKTQGTGLGLAIAARVVEQHGGQIAVDSVVGEGSTFVVTLPPAPPPARRSDT